MFLGFPLLFWAHQAVRRAAFWLCAQERTTGAGDGAGLAAREEVPHLLCLSNTLL